MLGHGGVLTAVVGGGRLFADRHREIAWGDPVSPGRPDDRPWPGSLPAPFPATVFPLPLLVCVVGSDGKQVEIDARGMLSGEPTGFSPTNSMRDLGAPLSWAGPWPVDERWWSPGYGRVVNRFQLVDAGGTAWLLALEDGRWWAEARYD